jgi:hypothetical protein
MKTRGGSTTMTQSRKRNVVAWLPSLETYVKPGMSLEVEECARGRAHRKRTWACALLGFLITSSGLLRGTSHTPLNSNQNTIMNWTREESGGHPGASHPEKQSAPQCGAHPPKRVRPILGDCNEGSIYSPGGSPQMWYAPPKNIELFVGAKLCYNRRGCDYGSLAKR